MNHDLYIASSPADVRQGRAIIQTMCHSVIYKGCALTAHRPDWESTFSEAKRHADMVRKPVYQWFGQAGQFGSEPIYTPKPRHA